MICVIHERDVLHHLAAKWNVTVLLELAGGPQRFNRLRETVQGGISHRMLSVTLRDLERDGLVDRDVVGTGRPPAVSYRLTPIGAEFVDLVRQVLRWARERDPVVQTARYRYDQRTSP